jgi:hypothetical protein
MPARKIQYTIRGIPEEVDLALRRRSRERGISLNQLLVEELTEATGGEPKTRRSLQPLLGKWQDDPEFDRILEEQRRIDQEMWR